MTASRPAIPDLNLYRRLRERESERERERKREREREREREGEGGPRETEARLLGSCLADRKSTKQIGAAVTKGLNARGDRAE
jgi:hypothetical protein